MNLRKILALIIILLGLFIIISQLLLGFSILLIVSIIIWLMLIVFIIKFIFLGNFSLWLMIVISLVIVIVSIILVPIYSFNKNGSSGNTPALTDANFDKKVLNITSSDGSIRGTIGLTKKTNGMKKEYLLAVYNLLIKTNLPFSVKCSPTQQSCKGMYTYAGRLVPFKATDTKTSSGSVSPVYCNKDTLAADPYSISGNEHNLATCGISSTDGLTTDTFSTNFQTNYYSYADVLKTTTFEIYDSSNYWEATTGETGSYTNKTDKAVQGTSPIKTLNFTVSE